MDEELAFLPGPPLPTLTAAPDCRTLTPSQTITPEEGAYVLHLANLTQSCAVSFSSPTNHISLLDKATLRPLSALRGHADGVTSLELLHRSTELLLSSAMDGTVVLWDTRTWRSAGAYNTGPKRKALLSLASSFDGNMIAAGTELVGDDASIYFWDIRKPSEPIYAHSSTHSDDITTLAFHPSLPHKLLSGSADGLLSVTDAAEQDEDEAVVHVGNWGCSVAAAGWSSGGAWTDKIWARSDMESLSTWDDELALLHDFGDVRRPASHGRWQTDYTVQCDYRGRGLMLLAGSNEGGFAQISAENRRDWSLERVFNGGHSAIVRCVLADEQNDILISGGEDSQLSTWRLSEEVVNSADSAMDIDPAPRTPVLSTTEAGSPRSPGQKTRKKIRYEPYPKAPLGPGRP